MAGIRAIAFVFLMLFAAMSGSAADGTPRNYVPELELSYVDPETLERVSCGAECKRFSVPAGVELEIRVRVQKAGGDPDDHGVPWDLWLDQRMHPFPGIDLAPCRDHGTGGVDLECWRSLVDRVDWSLWQSLVADRTCVPKDPESCNDVAVRVAADPTFEGSRGRGVYSVALWVDRFRSTIEEDEFDNFVGPVRVKVLTAEGTDPVEESGQSTASEIHDPDPVCVPLSPKPFTVRHRSEAADTSFTLSSQRSRATLEFTPLYPGPVTVDVEQSGVFEKMIVEVRKVSTGEVLVEEQGRGRLHLEGEIAGAYLKDDRKFEVVVRPDQGARGARGSITVTYPAAVMYIPWDETSGAEATPNESN